MEFFGIVWENSYDVPVGIEKVFEDVLSDVSNKSNFKKRLDNIMKIRREVIGILYRLNYVLNEANRLKKTIKGTRLSYYEERHPVTYNATRLKSVIESDEDVLNVNSTYEICKIQIKYFESMFNELKDSCRTIYEVMGWLKYTGGDF